jgi:hypothetical protein
MSTPTDLPAEVTAAYTRAREDVYRNISGLESLINECLAALGRARWCAHNETHSQVIRKCAANALTYQAEYEPWRKVRNFIEEAEKAAQPPLDAPLTALMKVRQICAHLLVHGSLGRTTADAMTNAVTLSELDGIRRFLSESQFILQDAGWDPHVAI